MTDSHRVYVGIGSNVDRERNISGGIAELQREFGDLNLSSVYESRAYGFDGDDFFNLVAAFNTGRSLREVTDVLRDIEFQYGRERGQEKYAPRTLDIDLLLYDDEVIDEGAHPLPREDVLRYSFVLRPLAEIAGDEVHPVEHKTYSELWREYTGNREDTWISAFDPLAAQEQSDRTE